MNYNPSVRTRRPARNTNSYNINNTYNEYETHEYEEEEEENINQRYVYQEPDDDDDDEEDDDDNDNNINNNDEYPHGYYRVSGTGTGTGTDIGESSRRVQKKRRLDNIVSNLGSNYDYAPRVGSSGDEWSENATYVLLEVWGERFMQLGRRSLRGEDWVEVAEKVSEMCKMEIDETQCRNRFEGLKNKYKKEKAKMANIMGMGGMREGYNGKWAFFKKMDMLLAPKKQHNGLPCGVDSGEYVFMNTKVYLNNSNALDEMRDSPCESETDDDDEGLDDEKDEEGFRLLAESVQNFGEIYEKIEGRKRQQMLELEKMRMDFQREMELQKKQILDRAQAEIAKIREGDDDVNSVENLSG